jgi:hypothetical protein
MWVIKKGGEPVGDVDHADLALVSGSEVMCFRVRQDHVGREEV